MARTVSPGSFHLDGSGLRHPWSFFVTDLIRRYGVRGVIAIVIAALFAFAPLTLLYWFNELRGRAVAIAESGQPVVVKPGRFKEEQERDEPGDTALLQVMCEVPTFNGWRELLRDEDPVRRDVQTTDSTYVRRERVYLRQVGNASLPFGLLGMPPVSAWLPPGDYEILVVHETPHGDPFQGHREHSFPWISVITVCSLEARRTTMCRISLPHYQWGGAEPIQLVGPDAITNDGDQSADELAPLLKACESVLAIPTPAGYLLALQEPAVQHGHDHGNCVADLRELQALPREWTRDQLAALRNWLPQEAQSARAKLSQLVDWLQWREFLESWFCYATAAIAGLVFTRWGAIALLEPWRRGDAWNESLALLVKIALTSVVLWFLFQILTDSSGCRGPMPIRIH